MTIAREDHAGIPPTAVGGIPSTAASWTKSGMKQFISNIADFGMDTITLTGPLPAKLQAVRAAGFSQIMLLARDIVGHEAGVEAAIRAVRESGLRVTGFQVLRDFEG